MQLRGTAKFDLEACNGPITFTLQSSQDHIQKRDSSGHARSVQLAAPKIALCFPHLFVCWFVTFCIPTYHMRNNYVASLLPCDFT